MKFIDLFAGIGGFRRGMELAGHKCVGFCEADKYAYMSYVSMHCITDEQRKFLATLPFKKRQKEILKDEYRNGDWYSNDIRGLHARDIPKCDCWCFGFPCQDVSIAGKQAGLEGTRSGLFFEVMRILGEMPEGDRPRFLFVENVKNLLSIDGGWGFASVLSALDEHGYDAEWQVLNSAIEGGVPQNRERVFIIGHSRKTSSEQVFPIGGGGKPINQKHDDPQRVAKIIKHGSDGNLCSIKDAYLSSDEVKVASCLCASDFRGVRSDGQNVVIVNEDNSSG